jgi:hypothetical protein
VFPKTAAEAISLRRRFALPESNIEKELHSEL